MRKRYIYDYYDVDIPDDCEEDADRRFLLAVNQARDAARIYAIPCLWYLVFLDGNVVRVCRRRARREKFVPCGLHPGNTRI